MPLSQERLPVKTTLLQNDVVSITQPVLSDYQSKRRYSKTTLLILFEYIMSDYQSKRRYSKTAVMFPGIARRAITSQNDATPKQYIHFGMAYIGAITSQNDATPKHICKKVAKNKERLPVKTTLLQNELARSL